MAPPSRIPAAALTDALVGGRYPFWFPNGAIQQNLAYDYFGYGCDFVPLAAADTDSQQISINNDSAFLCLSMTLVETSEDDLTELTYRPLLTQIADAGAGRNWFNQPMAVDNIFGTAQNPKYLDVPKLTLPNSILTVQMFNLENVARNVRVTLHGFKLFNFKAK